VAARNIDESDRQLDASPRVTTPNPDPTQRTKEDLQREIAALKEYFRAEHESLKALIDARFLSYDKAITLLQSNSDKLQSISVIEERVRSQNFVYEEKFKSIATQFAERDTRTEQTSRDSKVAIDAALKSQQEAFAEQNKSSALAIAKSETATAKQIDQLGVTFGETTRGITDKIDDLKDRLVNIEGRGVGSHATWGSIGGVIAAVAAGLVIVQIFLAFMMKH
jgi:hypothetical protein